jgi:hypothetical protein
MAYLTIQIDLDPNAATPAAGPSLGDLQVLLGGLNPSTSAPMGVSKPIEVLQNISNLIDGIKAGTVAAEISVASSSNADIVISAASVFSSVSGTGAVNISSTPLNFK